MRREPDAGRVPVRESDLDELIARILSPLHLLGVHRCDRCYIRVRRAQLGLLLTWPLQRLPPVQEMRRHWTSLVPSLETPPALKPEPNQPAGIVLPDALPFGGMFVSLSG